MLLYNILVGICSIQFLNIVDRVTANLVEDLNLSNKKRRDTAPLEVPLGMSVQRVYNSKGNLLDKIYGVNIGGWLVTEPYITPSLYDAMNLLSFQKSGNKDAKIVDEFTVAKYLGYHDAYKMLKTHVDTWYTEEDIRSIAQHGLNMVRVPIGYWAWKDVCDDLTKSTYLNGSVEYLDTYVNVGQLGKLRELVEWCKKYDLKVMIDLHGVPGSQNGFDNSGQRLFYEPLGWLGDLESNNNNSTENLTIAILEEIFKEFMTDEKYYKTVVAVELVNEPFHFKIVVRSIEQFYKKVLARCGKYFIENGRKTSFVVLHDAFEPLGFWNNYFQEMKSVTPNVKNQVVMDHHFYKCFTDYDLVQSQDEKLQSVKNYGDQLFAEQIHHPSLVGEFSAALDDCATYLNGYGIGSRYDGSYYKDTTFGSPLHLDIKPLGSCQSKLDVKDWSDEHRSNVAQFIRKQLKQYIRNSKGWVFWCWKTETAVVWDMSKLLKLGLFPTDFSTMNDKLRKRDIDDYESEEQERDDVEMLDQVESEDLDTSNTEFPNNSNSNKLVVETWIMAIVCFVCTFGVPFIY